MNMLKTYILVKKNNYLYVFFLFLLELVAESPLFLLCLLCVNSTAARLLLTHSSFTVVDHIVKEGASIS